MTAPQVVGKVPPNLPLAKDHAVKTIEDQQEPGEAPTATARPLLRPLRRDTFPDNGTQVFADAMLVKTARKRVSRIANSRDGKHNHFNGLDYVILRKYTMFECDFKSGFRPAPSDTVE